VRNISASLTKEQIRKSVELVRSGKAPVKDVTRRLGWRNAKVGERLQFCEKCQGLKPGESLVRICVVEVVSVRFERLDRMTSDLDYGFKECDREGFAAHPSYKYPSEFIQMFCDTHKDCTPETEITRLEFRYVV
jgi:hypothetical protein